MQSPTLDAVLLAIVLELPVPILARLFPGDGLSDGIHHTDPVEKLPRRDVGLDAAPTLVQGTGGDRVKFALAVFRARAPGDGLPLIIHLADAVVQSPDLTWTSTQYLPPPEGDGVGSALAVLPLAPRRWTAFRNPPDRHDSTVSRTRRGPRHIGSVAVEGEGVGLAGVIRGCRAPVDRS